jgi:hypothetical protein
VGTKHRLVEMGQSSINKDFPSHVWLPVTAVGHLALPLSCLTCDDKSIAHLRQIYHIIQTLELIEDVQYPTIHVGSTITNNFLCRVGVYHSIPKPQTGGWSTVVDKSGVAQDEHVWTNMPIRKRVKAN